MNESQTKKKICVRYSYFDETRYALAFLMKINMSIIPSFDEICLDSKPKSKFL